MWYFISYAVGLVISLIGYIHANVQPYPDMVIFVSEKFRILFATYSFWLGAVIQTAPLVVMYMKYKELLAFRQHTRTLL